MKLRDKNKIIINSCSAISTMRSISPLIIRIVDFMRADCISRSRNLYQVVIDKDSGITNDPNQWSDEPQYIFDLLKRIIKVSVESMKIINSLPPLEGAFIESYKTKIRREKPLYLGL